MARNVQLTAQDLTWWHAQHSMALALSIQQTLHRVSSEPWPNHVLCWLRFASMHFVFLNGRLTLCR